MPPKQYSTIPKNKLSSSHHALNSLLFALDGYPTATEDPAEIEETARTETVGGGDTGSGRERRDWVPLTGDPLFPSGRLYFFLVAIDHSTDQLIHELKPLLSILTIQNGLDITPQCISILASAKNSVTSLPLIKKHCKDQLDKSTSQYWDDHLNEIQV